MPNSFTEVFGGSTIYPAQIGYIEYTISQNTTLVWPDLGETSSTVAAEFIRTTATTTGLSYILPDANKASVGKVLRFKNIGTNAFNIQTAGGSTIQTLTNGEDCLFSITDNTTSGGLWDTSQIGNGTTSANASSLAGNGLSVSGTTLITNMPVVPFSSTPYSIPTSGMANLYEWQGGVGTVLIPDASTVSNGWYSYVKNAGTGPLTVSALIDGAAITLQPGNQSFGFDSDGVSWHSYGYVSLTALNVNSTYTKTLTTTSVSLTTTESQNNIIAFAGTLTADTFVNFPNTPFIYDITNSTSGSFNLTVQPSNGNGVIVPQNITRLVTNNAATMYFSDSISGTSIAAGSGLSSATSGSVQTLSIANTTVTSGVYGNNQNFSAITVNSRGQLTSALAIPFSGLTFTSITHVGTNTFTGIVRAPTVTAGDSSTSVATTAFVATARKISTVQFKDATDIALSTAPAQMNVGTARSITIPVSGCLLWYVNGAIIGSTGAAHPIGFGLRISSTNYYSTWTDGSNGLQYQASWNATASVAPQTEFFQGFGVFSVPITTAGGTSLVGLDIEKCGIPTGTQTCQIVAAELGAGTPSTIKGTTYTTIFNLVILDCTT